MSTAEPQLNADETKPTGSEIVEKHKEFLFPAVAMYYAEPLALVRGLQPLDFTHDRILEIEERIGSVLRRKLAADRVALAGRRRADLIHLRAVPP